MSKLDDIIKDFNKKSDTAVITVGLPTYKCKRIPFTSPRMNYCTFGGLPIGQIAEFFGEEHGGKTTTALDIVANYQQMEDAKKVLYIDAENTLDVEWATKLGVDVDSLVVFKPTTQSAEEIFQLIYDAVESDEVGLWVLDSIPALSSAQELEKTMEEEKILHKQFQLGMLLETDFLEYMTSVLQIENQRTEAEKNYKIQKGILNLALGLEEFAEIEFRDPLTPEAENAELEEHSKSIWNIVKNRSIELQKQDMAIEYSRKQQKYSDAWYLPNFSIKPSVSFSGEDFPLAKPNYSFQMSFSFENIPFAPVSISNNYSFSDKKLTGVSNSGSTNSFCQVTYVSDKRTAKLTLLQQQIQRQDNEKKMYSNLYQQIVTHDNYLKKITLLENTKKIQEKRLEFSKMQTEQGFIKPIKYLEQLIELSDTKNSLLQAKIQTIAAERIIAILTGIPFKELINAIY